MGVIFALILAGGTAVMGVVLKVQHFFRRRK